jgi:hypothetical protein
LCESGYRQAKLISLKDFSSFRVRRRQPMSIFFHYQMKGVLPVCPLPEQTRNQMSAGAA